MLVNYYAIKPFSPLFRHQVSPHNTIMIGVSRIHTVQMTLVKKRQEMVTISMEVTPYFCLMEENRLLHTRLQMLTQAMWPMFDTKERVSVNNQILCYFCISEKFT